MVRKLAAEMVVSSVDKKVGPSAMHSVARTVVNWVATMVVMTDVLRVVHSAALTVEMLAAEKVVSKVDWMVGR